MFRGMSAGRAGGPRAVNPRGLSFQGTAGNERALASAAAGVHLCTQLGVVDELIADANCVHRLAVSLAPQTCAALGAGWPAARQARSGTFLALAHRLLPSQVVLSGTCPRLARSSACMRASVNAWPCPCDGATSPVD